MPGTIRNSVFLQAPRSNMLTGSVQVLELYFEGKGYLHVERISVNESKLPKGLKKKSIQG